MAQLISNNIQLLKTIAVGVSGVIALAGVCLVFKGTQGGGTITIKFPFLETQLQTGSVGLLLIFFGVIIITVCLYFRYGASAETTEIKVGDLEVKLSGHTDQKRLEVIATGIGRIVEEAGKSKPHQP